MAVLQFLEQANTTGKVLGGNPQGPAAHRLHGPGYPPRRGRRLSPLFRLQALLFKEQGSTVNKERGKPFLVGDIFNLKRFSGQTAQLI